MFDALQVLQSQAKIEPESQLQKGVPNFSYLVNLRGVKLNDYEILYSKNAVKNSQIGK